MFPGSSLTYIWKHDNDPYQFSALEQKKNSFKIWGSEFNEFSFNSEKHWIIFIRENYRSSHRCLYEITEFNQ